ncbi:hypothetical protein MNBD_GAMMA06-1472 [hydrothermal vent metagenome]|uniref:Uncharacterized protein n=1 Tax=hydrothermal vent metagenome TaxID=652676 RepID=A0A3B0W4Q2_9ZZZZ
MLADRLLSQDFIVLLLIISNIFGESVWQSVHGEIFNV